MNVLEGKLIPVGEPVPLRYIVAWTDQGYGYEAHWRLVENPPQWTIFRVEGPCLYLERELSEVTQSALLTHFGIYKRWVRLEVRPILRELSPLALMRIRQGLEKGNRKLPKIRPHSADVRHPYAALFVC